MKDSQKVRFQPNEESKEKARHIHKARNKELDDEFRDDLDEYYTSTSKDV